jgi:hypothetical protein
LPHFWWYDEETLPQEDALYSTIIHFTTKLWGERFMEMPENIRIKNLMGVTRVIIDWSSEKYYSDFDG